MINWLSRTCVVIPTLNAGIFLSECLESLYSTQGKRANGLTILVLDGGSVDFTHDIVSFYQQKYGSIRLSKFPGSHPAQRINALIESKEFDYLMMCHADDIYNLDLRLCCLEEAIDRKDLIRGSQVAYFQSPLDCIGAPGSPIYSGTHQTHPLTPEGIISEMCHWWCISLNTACVDAKGLADLGFRYDWIKYKYSADYMLNWEVAKTGRISNSPIVTTITRHNGLGDGPVNSTSVASDFKKIREAIFAELQLSAILGPELLDKLASFTYSYGVFAGCDHITKADCSKIRAQLAGCTFQAGLATVHLDRLPLPPPVSKPQRLRRFLDQLKNRVSFL